MTNIDPATPLIAVDIGNSRIKLGLFEQIAGPEPLPLPVRSLEFAAEDWDTARLAAWIPGSPIWPQWWIASVNRPAATRLLKWIQTECLTPAGTPTLCRVLRPADLPLTIGVEHPERVGMDRLAGAAAANRLRAPGRAAVVVDVGTAITVDLLSTEGVFQGGAILPGIGMSARALNQFTDLLPLVPMNELAEPPPALGVSTVSAMRSGLYWGAIGAIRELAARLGAGLKQPPELFLTGGAAASVAETVGQQTHRVPHLVLSGIAVGAHGRMREAEMGNGEWGVGNDGEEVGRSLSDSSPPVVALLTPLGRGGVATVAVEGAEAAALVDRHFVSRRAMPLDAVPPGRIVYGRWRSATGEEVVVCRRSPHQVEIHCHGGTQAAARIVADISAAGAMVNEWREWVRQQESRPIRSAARTALAEARTERTAAILLDQYDGALDRAIEAIGAAIRSGRAEEAARQLDDLLRYGSLGLHLVEPWRVVLAGPPNVGKSSLINTLVGYRRSIVFDQPGTTRDVVRVSAALDGWPIELADTAGLHASDDCLEATGIERARQTLATADCIVLVFDRGAPWTISCETLTANWPAAIVVHNKSDLPPDPSAAERRLAGLATSALSGAGIDQLAARIAERLVPTAPPAGAAVPFTESQIAQLRALRASLDHDQLSASIAMLERLCVGSSA